MKIYWYFYHTKGVHYLIQLVIFLSWKLLAISNFEQTPFTQCWKYQLKKSTLHTMCVFPYVFRPNSQPPTHSYASVFQTIKIVSVKITYFFLLFYPDFAFSSCASRLRYAEILISFTTQFLFLELQVFAVRCSTWFPNFKFDFFHFILSYFCNLGGSCMDGRIYTYSGISFPFTRLISTWMLWRFNQYQIINIISL